MKRKIKPTNYDGLGLLLIGISILSFIFYNPWVFAETMLGLGIMFILSSRIKFIRNLYFGKESLEEHRKLQKPAPTYLYFLIIDMVDL